MPATDNIRELDRAAHTAHEWVNDVAREFHTNDREFAYRVLRAWLHALRDGLTADSAAHFAAQLPDLVRGIFYANWNPEPPRQGYHADAYAAKFAQDAGIAVDDVPKSASTVSAALRQHLSPELVAKAVSQLPRDIRPIVLPGSLEGSPPARPAGAHRR